jgi:uncharacterized protein with PIN domain
LLALYLDEDSMQGALIAALRSRGFDTVTAEESGLRRRPDSEHLEFAIAQGRILCTANARDFARLHGEYLRSGRHHSGIIGLRQGLSIGQRVTALERLAATVSQEEMVDRLEFLANWLRPRS